MIPWETVPEPMTILTEPWLAAQGYCPNCGSFPNGQVPQ